MTLLYQKLLRKSIMWLTFACPTEKRMYAPFGAGEQMYTLTFDPQTGGLVRMETMRAYDTPYGVLTLFMNNI
jgi:hypothetical protein